MNLLSREGLPFGFKPKTLKGAHLHVSSYERDWVFDFFSYINIISIPSDFPKYPHTKKKLYPFKKKQYIYEV